MLAQGARAPVQATTEVLLPLLGEMWSHESLRVRRIVLDLAGASGRSIGLFGQLACRATMLGFEDWVRGPQSRIGAASTAPFDELIPLEPAHRPNAVLCWDFLNYLDSEQLTQLATRICQVGREGMLFHALIAYTGDTMPAGPCHFRPTARDQVLLDEPDAAVVASPRYTPAVLMKLLPGVEVHKARLLRSGYQEYLLRWTGSTKPKSVVVKGFESSRSDLQTAHRAPIANQRGRGSSQSAAPGSGGSSDPERVH